MRSVARRAMIGAKRSEVRIDARSPFERPIRVESSLIAYAHNSIADIVTVEDIHAALARKVLACFGGGHCK